jgi:hypothetical protein
VDQGTNVTKQGVFSRNQGCPYSQAMQDEVFGRDNHFICRISDIGQGQRLRILERRQIAYFRVGVWRLCGISDQPSLTCT